MTVFSRSFGRGLVLLAALTLGLSACSSAPGPQQPAPAAGSGAAQSAPGTGVLGFTGTTLDGATLDASTLAGAPVVVWFWAPF